MASPSDIKGYVSRLREAVKTSGKSDPFKGLSQSAVARLAAEAYDPAMMAQEAKEPSPLNSQIRALGIKPNYTMKELESAQGGLLSNIAAAIGEGADPTGLYAPLYDPEFEEGYGRMAANLGGAIGSGVVMGPLSKVKYLPMAVRAALGSRLLQTGLNALQAQSGVTSEEQQYGYDPMSKGGKLALAMTGAASQGLRDGGKLLPKFLGRVGDVGVQTAASGIDTAAQILPSHALAERYKDRPDLNPAERYLQMIKDVQESELSPQDKTFATAASVGIPAIAMAIPGAMSSYARYKLNKAPQSNVQQPPSGAAAAAPVKPTPRERAVSSVTGDFVPTSDRAAEVAKSGDMYSFLQDMQNKLNPDRKSLPAPEINTINEDGSRVPLLGFRGRDRVITGTGDTHDPAALVRNQTQVMRIPLGGNTYDVTIDPGFMPGHSPQTLQPGIFAHRETKQPFIVIGNDPTSGDLLVFDPKTGKYYDGPPEVFPGSELVGKAPETTMDAEATRKANIEAGKRKEANRLERAGLPTQPHKATSFDDLDRQWEEIKMKMGWQKPMPSHNKFGE